MAPPRKKLDRELILSVAREVAQTERIPSREKVASRLGLVASTIAKVARREGWLDDLNTILDRKIEAAVVEPPGVVHNKDGSASLVSEAEKASSWTREGLLKAHGFDVGEWVVIRARANRWGDPNEPREQLRIDVVPKAGLVAFPDPGAWKKPPKPRKPRMDRERKVILTSDHHAPLYDKTLHARTLDLLADEQPCEGVLMGDLMDFSTISRFRERDGFAHGVRECLEGAFQILRDYREASPKTQWTMLPGNHDARLHYAIIDNVRELHRIAPAGEDVPSLDFRRLLHLDDLGIKLVEGDWEAAKYPLSRKLTVRHGYTTAKNAGEKMLTSLSRSTVQGHSHRLSLTLRTEHDDDPDEPTATRLAAEVGCMCEVAEGLGHAIDPDWHQGLMMVHLWPDGDFHLTPYFYVPGRLLGPGKRYQ